MIQEIPEPSSELNRDDGCHFTVLRGDIATQPVKAIALVIPHHLEIKGTLNGSVFKRAGSELDDYILENVMAPKPGEVFTTPGFNLPAEQIIFAVIPSWRSDLDVLDKHIKMAVQGIFEKAKQIGVRQIALPPLCCGKVGYKPERGLRLMIDAMFSSLDPKIIKEVRFVSNREEHLEIYKARIQKRLGT